ncbi:uncharacterized protein PAC_12684 [Phialocephala subalpina]|uniref:Uncharacterized protein n=1 Tax=Phialocephala subalpina TaxID=576137 RepID=A0A1L7XCU7_9HELO|nr:uncharacterized protein PAC_12684 [Phialocephala subalpina]
MSKDTVQPQEERDKGAGKVRIMLVRAGSRKKVKESHLFLLEDHEHTINPRGTGICALCFDIEPPDTTPDVFLVRLVAEDRHRKLETPSNNLTPEGIVLEAMQGRSDAYRRVGIWVVYDAMAAWMSEEVKADITASEIEVPRRMATNPVRAPRK